MTTRKTPRPPRVGIARFNLEVSPERLARYKAAADKVAKVKIAKEIARAEEAGEKIDKKDLEKKKKEHSLSAWVRNLLNRESDRILDRE
jgi:hypothetical protein